MPQRPSALRLLPSLGSPVMRLLMHLTDMSLLLAAAHVAWIASNGLDKGDMPERYAHLTLAAGLMHALLQANGPRSYRGGQFMRLASALLSRWVQVLVIGMLWLFVTKTSGEHSRAWSLIWAILSPLLLLGHRGFIYTTLRYLRSRGYNVRHIVVVGTGATISYLLSRLGPARWTGYRILAFISPEKCETIEQRSTDPRIDEIWLCLPPGNNELLQTTMYALRFSPKRIRFVPDVFTNNLLNLDVSLVNGVPMVDMTASSLDQGFAHLIKAVFDRLVGALILLLISPLMLAIAMGVKRSSPGPVFFKQKRHGWNGDVIEVWKFRTMKVHAEDGTVTQATLGDPRITPFGAFLRRTSLDELPQFINVLQGQMSIIGPRPHAIEHNERYKHLVPGYMLRHKCKPGITGWAQVNGLRGETDTLDKMQRRVEHDLYYISHWSFWLDLRIFVGTVFKGFSNKNAY